MITKHSYVDFSTAFPLEECFLFFFFFSHEIEEIHIHFIEENKPDIVLCFELRVSTALILSGKDDKLQSQATWVNSQMLCSLDATSLLVASRGQ